MVSLSVSPKHMNIRHIKTVFKWTINLLFMLIGFIVIWSLFVMIIEKNNPIIKSANLHQAYLAGGSIERAVTTFRIHKKLQEIIEADTGLDLTHHEIRVELVDLDNDTTTIEALSVLKDDEKDDNKLYIIQTLQGVYADKKINVKVLGILKNIRLPLSLIRNRDGKWLGIKSEHDNESVQVFSYIHGEYRAN